MQQMLSKIKVVFLAEFIKYIRIYQKGHFAWVFDFFKVHNFGF